MSLRDRLQHPDRRQVAAPIEQDRREVPERREPFVAPWRRRSLEQSQHPFLGVSDITSRAA